MAEQIDSNKHDLINWHSQNSDPSRPTVNLEGLIELALDINPACLQDFDLTKLTHRTYTALLKAKSLRSTTSFVEQTEHGKELAADSFDELVTGIGAGRVDALGVGQRGIDLLQYLVTAVQDASAEQHRPIS